MLKHCQALLVVACVGPEAGPLVATAPPAAVWSTAPAPLTVESPEYSATPIERSALPVAVAVTVNLEVEAVVTTVDQTVTSAWKPEGRLLVAVTCLV